MFPQNYPLIVHTARVAPIFPFVSGKIYGMHAVLFVRIICVNDRLSNCQGL